MTGPDDTPPLGTPIPVQHPEWPHPGEPTRQAPRLEGGHVASIDGLDEAIAVALDVRRIARDAPNDPAYRAAYPVLRRGYHETLQRLWTHPGDEEAWATLRRVRHALTGK